MEGGGCACTLHLLKIEGTHTKYLQPECKKEKKNLTTALLEERLPVMKHSIMTLSVYNIIDSCEGRYSL